MLQKQSYGRRRAFINIGDSVCEVSIVGFLIRLTKIPLVLLTKLGKRPLQLDLESKGQGHRKNQKTMPEEAINMPSTKMSRDLPSYWCVTDLANML